MTASSYGQPQGDLLFHWERPRHHKVALAGFLLASVALHALCFYLFQVVYPPAISLLPPPAQVSVITATTPEGHAFLDWLAAEDPALASQTQRPPEARAYQLPKLPHVPSYRAVPPRLKEPPPSPRLELAPSAAPPAPVPATREKSSLPLPPTPTTLRFSENLANRDVIHPALKFRASLREAPESARFRIGVDSLGIIRYIFLEESTGDSALDEEARQYLALCRFQPLNLLTNYSSLIWATASFDFGTDLQLPPSPAEHAP
ncbi:MAG TPA: hypothetical protein VGI60_08990 [Chthoniobacterales bacterium]|jgi:hypothetical protein